MLRFGIDLGGTKIEGVVLDAERRELFRERVPTDQSSYDVLLGGVERLYRRMADAAGGAAHTLGIGTPGAISPRTGLLKNAPNTACLIGRPVTRDLRARLGRGFAIENDANCFALALSLHAPTPELRHELMPIEKKYALAAVIAALARFRRRVTLEYVLIGGRNDAIEQADQLAQLARPLGALVNLLPLHPGGAPDLSPSPRAQMLAFERRLRRQGVEAVLRRSRGLDISAACGQLRVELEARRKVRTQEHARVE